MKNNLLVAMMILGGCGIAAVASSQPDGADLTVGVTTDRSSYRLGDPVTATVTKCNPTDQAITVPHSCICCHDELYAHDGGGNEVSHGEYGCILVIYSLHLEPGECSSRDFEWAQLAPVFDEGTQVAPGTYSIVHRWVFPDFTTETESAPFELGAGIEVPTLNRPILVGLVLLLASLGVWWSSRWSSGSLNRPGD